MHFNPHETLARMHPGTLQHEQRIPHGKGKRRPPAMKMRDRPVQCTPANKLHDEVAGNVPRHLCRIEAPRHLPPECIFHTTLVVSRDQNARRGHRKTSCIDVMGSFRRSLAHPLARPLHMHHAFAQRLRVSLALPFVFSRAFLAPDKALRHDRYRDQCRTDTNRNRE
jgi:hypothetical protein